MILELNLKKELKGITMRYNYRNGFIWLFIYFLLALCPLSIAYLGNLPDYRSFWIELGVALGFIGLSLFGLQFIFSGRFKKIAPAFGMDNVIQFHKEMGIVSVLFVLAHPVILLATDPEFFSYFDPGVNFFRAIALISVTIAILLLITSSLWRLSYRLSYENWRLAHGVLSVFVVFVGIVHSIQVGHYLEPLWKKIAVAVLLSSCMYLLFHTRITRPYINRKRPYQLVNVKAERDECYTIKLAAKNHLRLQFLPGQFVWLTIHSSPFSLQQHPFSISSSAMDKNISVTAKELGDFTKTWKNLKIGTTAFLEGPFGSFYLKGRPCFFLIGGIGITPAMSMLRTLRDKKETIKTVLIYGNLDWEKIPFREELEEISNEIDLKIIHVLENPEEDWKGEKGFVSKELISKNLPEDKNGFDYFICGPGPLMDISESSLRELGVDWRNIYSERFEIV